MLVANPRTALASLLVCLAACAAPSSETDDANDTDDDAEALASAEPASRYNADPFAPTNGVVPYECIAPRGPSATSTFFDGSKAFYSWRDVDFSGTTCRPGELRVARWERLRIDGQEAYVMRGGGGKNADEQWGVGGIRFGHVLASDLSKGTSVLTKYVPGRVGREPKKCNGHVYTNDPAQGTTPDLSALYYKPDQPPSSGAKWDNYGDQAGTGPTHYSYVLWTWPVKPDGAENRGGGQVRAIVAGGEEIRACNVAPAYLPMYRARSSRAVGRFEMLYGRARNAGGEVVYGWFPVAWQLDGRPWRFFVR